MGLFRGIKKRIGRVGKFVKKNVGKGLKAATFINPSFGIMGKILDSSEKMPTAGKRPASSRNLMEDYTPPGRKKTVERKNKKGAVRAVGGLAAIAGIASFLM